MLDPAMKRRCFFFIFCLFLFAFSQSVTAANRNQSSLRIPTSDPIYRILDQLLAFGLVSQPLYGVRPWSKREIDSYLDIASKHWQQEKKDAEDTLHFNDITRQIYRQERIAELWKAIDRYTKRWGEQGEDADAYSVDFLKFMQVDFAYTDEQPHTFANNNVGAISASVAPYSEYRQGRPLVKGAQYKWETGHGFQLGSHLSGYFQPYFYFQFPDASLQTTGTQIQASVHELYSRLVWANVALQVGRSSLELGQGEHGGFLLTDNARPLDGIQLMNDEPFLLPSFLKYLGKTRMLFHIETLGPDYAYKNSLFSGLDLQVQPLRNWELGFGYSTIFGGEGATTPNSLGGYLQDYFGFVPFLSSTNNTFSNRMFGINTRVTLSKNRGAQIYAEMALDDKTFQSIQNTLKERAAYLFGFYLPRLNDSGTLDLRLESKYLGPIFYRHSGFPYVENGQILGDPLGPDGMSESLSLGYAVNAHTRVNNRLSLELRDSDTYTSTGNNIIRTADNPQEVFLAWHPSIHRDLNDTTSLALDFSYQRVFNTAYISGDNENQVFAGLTLSRAFPSFTVGLH